MRLNASMLGALRCFEVAARHCNFTRAATELHLTPGAVSQQMRSLEEKLDVPLFQRLPRGLVLTDAGSRLHAVVADSLARLEDGIASVQALPGALRVSCSPSFAMLWLMPRLNRFHRDHPELEIKLVAEFQSVDRADMLASNTDIAIRYDPAVYDGVYAQTLMPEWLVAVASPQYLARHAGFEPEALLAHATLLHDAQPWDGAEPGAEWNAWLAAVHPGFKAGRGDQAFNLSMLTVSAAKHHRGIAMGRMALVADDLESGALVDVFGSSAQSPGRYVLLATHDQDPRVIAFTQWLKHECALAQQSFRKFARVGALGLPARGAATGYPIPPPRPADM